jgi:uncharacterized protein YcfL
MFLHACLTSEVDGETLKTNLITANSQQQIQIQTAYDLYFYHHTPVLASLSMIGFFSK